MNRHGLSDADLVELAADPAFQDIVASDAELDRLDAETYDEKSEFLSLITALGLAPLRVGDLPVRPLTPAKWAFLWAIGSPYVRGGTCAALDADVFLFVLAKDLRDLGCTVERIPEKARCLASASGLSFEQAHREILSLISVAFLPLQLLPKDRETDGEKPRFDVEWLADLVSAVSRESGEPARHILHEMPLNAACALYVSARKAVDTDHAVRRRPSAEIAHDILDRTYALGREYLDRKRKGS